MSIPGTQIVAVVLAATQLLAGCATPGLDPDSAALHATAPSVLPDRSQGSDESVAEKQTLGAISHEGTGRRWHVDLAIRTGHLKLSSTEQKLDRRLDLPLSLGTFNLFPNPQTPIDRNTDLGLSTFYLGVGREESDRFIWTAYAGAGAWRDRTSRRSLMGKLSVRFRYAIYYAGLTTELYPWGTPRYGRDLTLAQGLAASRPFVLAGAELGFVNARGAGDLKVLGINVYKDSQGIRDWVFSGRLGAGWALPMGEHWSLNLTGDYTHHLYRPEEYNSWNVTTVLRYRF